MTVNRKLNHTTLQAAELRLGNLVHFAEGKPNQLFVIVGMDLSKSLFQISSLVGSSNTDELEEITEKIVELKSLKGVPLWTKYNQLHEGTMRDLNFIAVKSGEYVIRHSDFHITVADQFFSKDFATLLVMEGNTIRILLQIWYLHELQNAIYIGSKIQLSHRLMINESQESNSQ